MICHDSVQYTIFGEFGINYNYLRLGRGRGKGTLTDDGIYSTSWEMIGQYICLSIVNCFPIAHARGSMGAPTQTGAFGHARLNLCTIINPFSCRIRYSILFGRYQSISTGHSVVTMDGIELTQSKQTSTLEATFRGGGRVRHFGHCMRGDPRHTT